MTLEPLFDRLTESHVPGVSRVGYAVFDVTDRLVTLYDDHIPLRITTRKRLSDKLLGAFELGRDSERLRYSGPPSVEPQRRRGHLHLVV